MSARLDADRIAPGLYQGGAPPFGSSLRRAGFDVVVLTAVEYQPPASLFEGIKVVLVPLDDHLDLMTMEEIERICMASHLVARALVAGKRVLVTCHQGINRSGLVTAVSLALVTGSSASRAVQVVREGRQGALCNRSFVSQLPAILRICRGDR